MLLWDERGRLARRPARSRASSGGTRCSQWRTHDLLFGDDRSVGWRQRSGVRTAGDRCSSTGSGLPTAS